MARPPKDATPVEQFRWALEHEQEVTGYWRAQHTRNDKVDDKHEDILERLASLERDMVTHSQLQETVDRAQAATHEKLDDLGTALKESTETITLTLKTVPVITHRVASLEESLGGTAQAQAPKPTHENRGSMATIIGTVIVGITAAITAAYKALSGGD